GGGGGRGGGGGGGRGEGGGFSRGTCPSDPVALFCVSAHRITRSSVFISLLYIWVTAGFWSAAPLLGWGSYTDRGYGTCEIDWSKASYSAVYRSYIISIFVFCFFVPVLIMFFCYVSIINTVKRGNALSANGDLTDRQRKIERDVTIVMICTAFILAWSPYAVVSMWSACGFHVPNLTSIFTRLFAKSASFYNPLIYFASLYQLKGTATELGNKWHHVAGNHRLLAL
uniref:G-protein coupled receptors family 1 profile domain-containing protein n=1 Tax=Poecilia mexicana TaxID=48701 RepID=A0A3B3YX10_9TELE